MLGLADRTRVIDLFEALMRADMAAALAELRGQYDSGADPAMVLGDLAEFTHFVTRVKVVPSLADDVSLTEAERIRGRAFATKLSMRVLARCWQMLLKGIAEVEAAGRPIDAAEMVLVRIAYAADLPTPDEVIRSLGDTRGGNGASPTPPSPASGAGTAAARRRRAPNCARSCAARAGRLLPPLRWRRRAQRPIRRRATRPREIRAVNSFADLIALAAEKRDLATKSALERDVRLVRFEDGMLELALEPSARKTLGRRTVEKARRLDRPPLDGRGLRRSAACRRCAPRPRPARRSSRTWCARIRWCKRCWHAFPAPRSSMSARRREIPKPRPDLKICRTYPRTKATPMPDFLGLMKQATELKSKMEAMQAELDRLEVEGSAGGGLVTVKLSGKGDLRGLRIDDSLFKPDQKEIVEDLLVAAHADAKRKLETQLAEKMQALTGGLPLPPGLKLF